MAPRWVAAARVAFLAALGLPASGVAAGDQAIWLTAIQPFTGGEWDGGISMKIACQIILDEINRHPSLLPGYELKIAWQDGQCKKHAGTQLFLQNLFDHTYTIFAPRREPWELDADGDGTVTTADTEPMSEVWNSSQVRPSPVGLMSGCSGTAMSIANIAYMARFPVVSNIATRPSLSVRSSYPNFFRTIMPDTTFNAAWIAMAKQLGHSSVSVVIGELENWASMGTKLAEEAVSQGVQLMGNDLTADMPGFYGMRVALDSQAMAAAAAADLLRLKQRIVILLMFHKRNRLVLCEAFKLNYRNAVYMPMGWLPFGWWSLPDTQCTPGQLTDMAVGFISANMMFWRGDMEKRLSCSSNMTAQQFQDEWYRRQGGAPGDLSMRPEGYAPVFEAATTVDAACMYATMLHEVLINRAIPLSELTERTRLGYSNVIGALSSVDFEGVQGRVRFAPNSADLAGSVVLQQLQDTGGSPRLLDVASYQQPTLHYLGRGDLVFQFPGERFPAGPVGAASIAANLSSFAACSGNTVLDMLSNRCVDCPANTQLVQMAGACLCVAGYYEVAGGCAPCPGGSISTAPGALRCTSCGLGRHARPGSTTCSLCPRGKFSNSSGLEVCHDCPPLQTTSEIASEGVAECVCEVGAHRSEGGSATACVTCPRDSTTSGMDSPNISSCLCAGNTYMDTSSGATCRRCPPGSTATGIGKTSVRSCLCEKGTYMPLGAAECLPCPEGMLCPRGSNAGNRVYLSLPSKSEEQEFPKLQPGFWSSASEPMSVFVCRSAEKCPGNRYPGDACAASLVARACDHCDVGYHWAGTRCSQCTEIETTRILFPVLPALLVPCCICIMYRFFGDQFVKWSSWQNGVTALAFVTLNHFQTVDIMSDANILSPLSDVFSWLQFTNDGAAAFKLDCVGMADFRSAMIMRGLAPLFILASCATTFLASIAIAKITRRAWVILDIDRLCNVFGSIVFTFFSGIAEFSLLLYKCTPNPNGTESLIADMSIICFESAAWRSMLIASIVFVLVYIVGMGGAFVRAVLMAPRYFVDARFQMRWKFLFIKFRADVYWWSIVFLAKNFFINLAFVITAEGVAQLYISMLVTTVYLMLVVGMNPYRHRVANALEIVVGISVIYVAALLTWYSDRLHGRMDHSIKLAIVLICAVPPTVAAGCIVHVLRFGHRFPAPRWQQQQAEKDFKDLVGGITELSFLSAEEGAAVLLSMADWDRWYMKQVARAVKTDVIGGTETTARRLVDRSLQRSVSQSILVAKTSGRSGPSMVDGDPGSRAAASWGAGNGEHASGERNASLDVERMARSEREAPSVEGDEKQNEEEREKEAVSEVSF